MKDQELIQKSGMITHLKTVDLLKKNGWSLNISSYYYDNVADQVKEIDIIAEKEFNSWQNRKQSSEQLNIQLFIECKYINQEIIFWFDEMNRRKAVETLENNTELKILELRSGADILPDKFHYLRETRVAKLFSSNINNEDVIYKAISQCLRAQVYYEQWASGPILHDFDDHPDTDSSIVRFPVVVVDNFENLREVEIGKDVKDASTKAIEKDFLIETNYVYFNKDKTSTRDDYFLIDLVDADKLDSFLKDLDVEGKSLVSAMSLKH